MPMLCMLMHGQLVCRASDIAVVLVRTETKVLAMVMY